MDSITAARWASESLSEEVIHFIMEIKLKYVQDLKGEMCPLPKPSRSAGVTSGLAAVLLSSNAVLFLNSRWC